jgi:hypothetical protein
MKHSGFTISQEFLCGEKRWRCTDNGTKVIVATCLDDHSDDPSWFNSPPYAVEEIVFDEEDIEGCEPATAITQAAEPSEELTP